MGQFRGVENPVELGLKWGNFGVSKHASLGFQLSWDSSGAFWVVAECSLGFQLGWKSSWAMLGVEKCSTRVTAELGLEWGISEWYLSGAIS